MLGGKEKGSDGGRGGEGDRARNNNENVVFRVKKACCVTEAILVASIGRITNFFDIIDPIYLATLLSDKLIK